MKELTREDWQKNPTPRMMWVWNNNEGDKVKRLVVHCFSRETDKSFVAERKNDITVSYWKHCAEITKEPKRMTNYEVAKWIADGASCGEFREYSFQAMVFHDYTYTIGYGNEPCDEDIRIRSNGGEWHEPLI